jgi:hypothetical protein
MKDVEITEIEVIFKIKPRQNDENRMTGVEEIGKSFKQWAQFIGWTVNQEETNDTVEYYANLTTPFKKPSGEPGQ